MEKKHSISFLFDMFSLMHDFSKFSVFNNDVDIIGRTSLHLECMNNKANLDKINDLISNGCDVNAKDNWGETPLHIAARNANSEVIYTLLKKGASHEIQSTMYGNTPFHEVCIFGNVNCVKILLDNGQDIEVTNIRGNTPLIEACRSNNKDVVTFLICRGADVDYLPEGGRCARDIIEGFKESLDDIKKKNM